MCGDSQLHDESQCNYPTESEEARVGEGVFCSS